MNHVDKEVFRKNFNLLLAWGKMRNMRQKEIADALGVSKQTLSMWKTGERTPKLPTIRQIASLFEIDDGFLSGIYKSALDAIIRHLRSQYVSVDEWDIQMLEVRHNWRYVARANNIHDTLYELNFSAEKNEWDIATYRKTAN